MRSQLITKVRAIEIIEGGLRPTKDEEHTLTKYAQQAVLRHLSEANIIGAPYAEQILSEGLGNCHSGRSPWAVISNVLWGLLSTMHRGGMTSGQLQTYCSICGCGPVTDHIIRDAVKRCVHDYSIPIVASSKGFTLPVHRKTLIDSCNWVDKINNSLIVRLHAADCVRAKKEGEVCKLHQLNSKDDSALRVKAVLQSYATRGQYVHLKTLAELCNASVYRISRSIKFMVRSGEPIALDFNRGYTIYPGKRDWNAYIEHMYKRCAVLAMRASKLHDNFNQFWWEAVRYGCNNV